MRRKQTLLLGVLALTSISALSGCNQSSGADENTLTVVCLNKGYGKEWIEDLAAKWEEANPGKKINLDANAQAATIISKHLASKNNPDDLYISVGKSWLTYAGSGKFASLDDLMEEEVDGKKVKDKVNSEFSTSLQQTGIDGQKHTYHLPCTRGIGGIYHNAKLLRQVQGWENKVPSTTAELLQLVSDIKSAKLTAGVDLVKPFVFTGRNADYFDYTVLSWWGQLAGKEAISEFLKYSSASSFDYTNLDGAYSKLKTAVDTWYAIFGDASNYVSGSLSKSNDDAQQDFLNGKAVMMMDCDWIYNEMLGYNTKNHTLPASMELAMMKTPKIDGAVYEDTYYVVGDDQYMAIPATSDHQDLAKSFLKFIISDQGCQTFFEKAHGFLAYDFTPEGVDNSYLTSLMDVRSSMKSCFTKASDSPLYVNGNLDIWGTAALRPFNALLSSNTTVEAECAKIKTTAEQSWGEWVKNWGE